MQPVITDALEVLIAGLVIAASAFTLLTFRPSKRRRRRRRRHSPRPRIDLFKPAQAEPGADADA
jgi:hypothetical protein